MDFAALQTALRTWVQTQAGLDLVVFENEPRPRHGGQLGILSWVTSAGIGAETRYEDNGLDTPQSNIHSTLVTYAAYTLQIAVETWDQRPERPHSRAALERLRGRAWLLSSLEALRLANVSIIDLDAVSQADYRVDQRWISRAVLTVRMNITDFQRDDLFPGYGPAIRSTDVTSAIENIDGTDLPASLQENHEDIP